MKFTVKWVENNLGITRKALRNYELNGLMAKESSRNPLNNYREYSEEDIDRIWSIKLLQGIGFSVKEIYELIETPDFDFYSSISSKVIELEKKRDEIEQLIKVAKTIKLTGMMPNVKQVGNMKFDDFTRYARENWSIYSEPKAAQFAAATEKIASKPVDEWTFQELTGLEEIIKSLNYEDIVKSSRINAYYKLLTELRFMNHTSELVQTVVKMLYEYLSEQYSGTESAEKYTPQFFARYTISSFADSDFGIISERQYGKAGCQFIAEAIAYFGGYKSIDEI